MKEEIKSGYLRVTDVISPFSGMHNIPKDILTAAADRGKMVHNIIDGIIQGLGEPEESEISNIMGYVNSFKQWFGEGFVRQIPEQRFYDDTLMITGQVDLMYKDPGTRMWTIIDFKTSAKESKTWATQGSAYQYLGNLNGYAIEKVIFLQLKKDGGSPVAYHYNEDFEVFRKCLDLYRHFYSSTSKEDFISYL